MHFRTIADIDLFRLRTLSSE